MSTPQHWWIRRAGRIDGPLTDREIRQLAAQQRIDAATELSRDRRHWASAARIPGLSVSAASQPPVATPPSSPAPPPLSRSSAASHRQLAGIVGVVFAGLAAFIGLFFVVFLVTAASRGQPSPVTDAVAAEDVQRNATWEYWHSVRALPSTVPKDIRTPAQAAAAVERIALQIEQLPTLNVDLDAVSCGHTLATFLRSAGQQLRRQNSPDLMAESMLRGLAGDPFGTALEEVQRNKAFEAQAGSVMESCRQTRAVLTARYGLEFPSLLAARD